MGRSAENECYYIVIVIVTFEHKYASLILSPTPPTPPPPPPQNNATPHHLQKKVESIMIHEIRVGRAYIREEEDGWLAVRW